MLDLDLYSDPDSMHPNPQHCLSLSKLRQHIDQRIRMGNTTWLCSKLQRALFAVRDVRAEDAYQGDDRDISSFFRELLPRVQEGFLSSFFIKFNET